MSEEQERLRRRRKKAMLRRQILKKRIALTVIALAGVGVGIYSACVIRAEKAEQKEIQQKKEEQAAKEKAEEERKQERKDAHQEAEEEQVQVMENLKEDVENLLSDFSGEWSVYIQEMNYDNEIVVNNTPMYPASLIKLFAMAASYENMGEILEHEKAYADSEEAAVEEVGRLLEEMITVSDNEAYNELVKLQSADRDFTEACSKINAYLEENGFEDTEVHTTLHPAYSSFDSDNGGDNVTTVKDCGKLLEQIYKGSCISQEKSASMLHLLLKQENTVKIPGGLPKGTKVANKTGETSDVQHDVAIVYGEETDFILCIMTREFDSEEGVYSDMHELSQMVYETLNP